MQLINEDSAMKTRKGGRDGQKGDAGNVESKDGRVNEETDNENNREATEGDREEERGSVSSEKERAKDRRRTLIRPSLVDEEIETASKELEGTVGGVTPNETEVVEALDEEGQLDDAGQTEANKGSPGVTTLAWTDMGRSVKALRESSGKLENEIERNRKDIKATRAVTEIHRRNLDAFTMELQQRDVDTRRSIEEAKTEMREIMDLRMATLRTEIRSACAGLITESRTVDTANTERQLEELRTNMRETQTRVTRAIALGEGQMNEPINNPGDRRNGRTTVTPARLQLPKFDGSGRDRPLKFLRDLERYCNAARVEATDFKLTVSQSLTDIASDWWQVVEEGVADFDQFKEAFAAKFWSEAMQDRVLMVLNTFSYTPDGKTTRVEYATRLFATARDLTPRLEEKTLVRKVARHFTHAILTAVISNGVDTMKKFLDILEIHDQTGNANRRPAARNEGTRGTGSPRPYNTEASGRNNRGEQTSAGNQNRNDRQMNMITHRQGDDAGTPGYEEGTRVDGAGNE